MTDDKFSPVKAVDVLNARGIASKREYVRELETQADAQAMAMLAACLCDESWFLRDLAEEAFLRLGLRGAPVLVPLLDKGLWYSRASACRVLGRLGYRPAVPALFQLTRDVNETVADTARDALVAIGGQRGAVRLALALHGMPPDVKRRLQEEIAVRDRGLGERLDRLMRNEELMSVGDPDSLSDDSPAVRALEEGVIWEVLTGPPPPEARSDEAGGGRG